jgi:ATP-binding cassette subfamily C protein CydCD
VTHRLAALDAFDEVVVLERGRVVERGRAADLRSRGGCFARLLALQHSVDALNESDAFAALDPRERENHQ